ncbi:hypothetical protein CC1G_08479 [Coprinopsis cinerea okayama7|uniref:Uncharacterized protein n=1 Tax=Coprinopsis cinerea (strain Okayama-7 / 130 / ATCC MYA-4618 / FGSC 9003) TaxID=240176 RepID=A8NM33_COPC7|nr:hypothetical protein CC1G_08479 [Coprinopsis cinerea okayama7\|eukprot:XP_001834834.1 hypothetical protein CC1G_08479 [Coprinopsis cinerea okayama7\
MFNNRESDNQFQPDTQIRYGHAQATGGSDFADSEPPECVLEEPPEYIPQEMREFTPEELQTKTKRTVLEMLTVLLECTHLPPDWFRNQLYALVELVYYPEPPARPIPVDDRLPAYTEGLLLGLKSLLERDRTDFDWFRVALYMSTLTIFDSTPEMRSIIFDDCVDLTLHLWSPRPYEDSDTPDLFRDLLCTHSRSHPA